MAARNFYLFAALQVVVVCCLLWFVLTMPVRWDVQRGVGAVLIIAGVVGIGTARYQLGQSFSVSAKAHKLVTHGVYSKIRNPIYVFGTIMIAGLVLVIRRPIGWLIVLVIIVIQTIRARREARVLESAFGDAYREYRGKTWF